MDGVGNKKLYKNKIIRKAAKFVFRFHDSATLDLLKLKVTRDGWKACWPVVVATSQIVSHSIGSSSTLFAASVDCDELTPKRLPTLRGCLGLVNVG